MTDMQLLILGNGFDLQCGLKSTFNDFEEPRLTELTKMDTMVGTGKQIPYTETHGPDGNPMNGNTSEIWFWSKKLTLWDLILKEEQQAHTWYDIEECIKWWTKNIEDKMEYSLSEREHRATHGNNDPDSPRAPLFWNQDIRQAIKQYATYVYNWKGAMRDFSKFYASNCSGMKRPLRRISKNK